MFTITAVLIFLFAWIFIFLGLRDAAGPITRHLRSQFYDFTQKKARSGHKHEIEQYNQQTIPRALC